MDTWESELIMMSWQEHTLWTLGGCLLLGVGLGGLLALFRKYW